MGNYGKLWETAIHHGYIRVWNYGKSLNSLGPWFPQLCEKNPAAICIFSDIEHAHVLLESSLTNSDMFHCQYDLLVQLQDMHEDMPPKYLQNGCFNLPKDGWEECPKSGSNSPTENHGMAWYIIHSHHRTRQPLATFFPKWCWNVSKDLRLEVAEHCHWGFSRCHKPWRGMVLALHIEECVQYNIYLWDSTKIFRFPLFQLALS